MEVVLLRRWLQPSKFKECGRSKFEELAIKVRISASSDKNIVPARSEDCMAFIAIAGDFLPLRGNFRWNWRATVPTELKKREALDSRNGINSSRTLREAIEILISFVRFAPNYSSVLYLLLSSLFVPTPVLRVIKFDKFSIFGSKLKNSRIFSHFNRYFCFN